MKFFFFTEFSEILDIALQIKNEGHDVLMNITETEYKNVGEGMIEMESKWWNYIGKGYVWVFDGCNSGNMQDWLRRIGESVIGGTEKTDELENIRQLNQKWFEELGFKQPYSQNFTNIDQAIKFIEKNKEGRYILKQNGDAPKSLNHMAKFDGGVDMIFHLKELKKGWNEQQYGKVDFDLMEVIEGTEVAASAFFNGHDWLRDKDGLVVGFLNFEHKKHLDGDLGASTGETGTLFLGCTEKNKIFNMIMMNPKISEYLKKVKFHGVFDINGCISKDGKFVGFEPTSRFGVPATSYEFIEGLNTPTATVFEYMANGVDKPISIYQGIGMVMVVYGPPFPTEVDMEETATSLGEKLWIIKNGKPVNDFDDEQKKHIHLYNFHRIKDKENGDICYKVATKHGYLLTVTGRGKTVEECRKNLIQYIKDNIFITDMGYRTDIGEKYEKYLK